MSSREVDALIAFAKHLDPSVVVTATTGGAHVSDSYHYRQGTGGEGLAVDFAFEGSNQPARMLALARGFESVGSKLAELFHDPLGHSWKNGQRVAWVLGTHFDHVHVAVSRGTFLSVPSAPTPAPAPKVAPMYNPPFQVDGRVVAWLNNYLGSGGWLLTETGAVYAFGSAPFYGGANTKSYFAGRVGAQLVHDDETARAGKVYTVIASSGERYSYPE